MEHIFLCGFMGCGKSTVGKQLAKLTGKRFIDLDKYITDKADMTIPEIFSTSGEVAFRQLETDCLKELSQLPGAVVALGGGTLMREENVKFTKQNGKTVFLNPSFKVCYNRIKGDSNRPLVVNNTKEELLKIYESRESVYKNASDVEITEKYPPYLLAKQILKRLKMQA